MKKLFLLFIVSLSYLFTEAQDVQTISQPEIIPVKLERISKAVRDVPEAKINLNAAITEHENEALEHHMPIVNPDALPHGADAALQTAYAGNNERSPSSVTVNILANLQGLSASVNPSDNTIAVGQNHVVQLTNNSTSTLMRIWDKAGNVLVNSRTIQSFSGIADYGDPNIIYDQAADRYVYVLLYSRNKKMLEVGVSKTNDPSGNYWIYSFATPNGFPDYPKIGVWGNSYFITTNSSSPTVYALNRTSMLSGSGIGTAQMFSMSRFSSISFQAASPVSFTGSTAAPVGEPATMIRVADDAWSTTLGPDHLELFSVNINWTTPSNSTMSGPIKLNTIAYNSSLCGFSSSACIPQPGTNTKLDPLSDIVMDKVQYRNFGTFESMTCSHVCNADGNGTAGIRWYELRRNYPGDWSIYQQSTYSPNTNGRFMSSICMNDKGSVALGYNASSTSVYPSIRITGRDSCDALNNMTIAETTTTAGTASNGSTRYGDYNSMVADPVDGSFWFTAQYNSASLWSTKLVHFNFSNCPAPRNAPGEIDDFSNSITDLTVAPNPAFDVVKITYSSIQNKLSTIELFDITGSIVMSLQNVASGSVTNVELNINSLSGGVYFVRVGNNKSTAIKRLVVQK